jgi:hypothetical protein
MCQELLPPKVVFKIKWQNLAVILPFVSLYTWVISIGLEIDAVTIRFRMVSPPRMKDGGGYL